MQQINSSTTFRAVELKAPGPFARLLMLLITITLAILAFIILIPLLLIAAVLGLVLLLYLKIKSLFNKAHQPNGPLDGRQNVKVINPDE